MGLLPGELGRGSGSPRQKQIRQECVCVCVCVHIYIYTYIDMVGSNEVYECALWLEGGKAELVA